MSDLNIEFQLLPWQAEVQALRQTYPLIVVNAGVHTGKTVFGSALLLEDMLLHPGEMFWWVAGLKFQLEAMWEEFAPKVRLFDGVAKEHPQLSARLPNGARMFGVSAENVENIASHHPLAIYGDEVAKWRLQAWRMVRVRLVRAGGGRGVFFSTPRANHWRDLIRWGRERKDGRWALVECTTGDAGIVSAAEIEGLRRDLPEEDFQQEIMARPQEGAGMVFRRVRECATGKPADPEAVDSGVLIFNDGYGGFGVRRGGRGEGYVIGYDPAKLRDFGVCVVRHKDRVVHVSRWQEMSYTNQVAMVADLAKRYKNARVVMDVGGPGQMIYEQLCKVGVRVTDFTFTNENKQTLVDELALRFEQGKIVLPTPESGPNYAILMDELTAFERRKTASGLRYTYSAPEGSHDDCVSALLLAFGGMGDEPVAYVVNPSRGRPASAYGRGRSWINTDYGPW